MTMTMTMIARPTMGLAAGAEDPFEIVLRNRPKIFLAIFLYVLRSDRISLSLFLSFSLSLSLSFCLPLFLSRFYLFLSLPFRVTDFRARTYRTHDDAHDKSIEKKERGGGKRKEKRARRDTHGSLSILFLSSASAFLLYFLCFFLSSFVETRRKHANYRRDS